jgi:hypothetical protein
MGKPADLQELISQVTLQREKKLLDEIARNQAKGSKLFDARFAAAAVGSHALFDYEPMAKWEKKGPSKKQLGALEKFGVDGQSVLSRGQASAMLDVLVKRAGLGLATLRQVRALRRFGLDKAEKMTYVEATKTLDRLIRTRRCPAGRSGLHPEL